MAKEWILNSAMNRYQKNSLKRKAAINEQEATTTVFNIYSPVGAIQTGNSSIANITQGIDDQVREHLVKVLEEIAGGDIGSTGRCSMPGNF